MDLTQVQDGGTQLCKVTTAGTPMYIAPELFTSEFVTPTDVWAFGIILVEVMTEKYSWSRMLNMDMSATFQEKNCHHYVLVGCSFAECGEGLPQV